MAEFLKVIKESKRMCKQIGICNKCPLSFNNNEAKALCNTFILEFPEDAERIIMKWAEENPLKTNRDKFREVFGYDFTQVVCAADWCNAEYEGENKNG